jgi:hypothetical protein
MKANSRTALAGVFLALAMGGIFTAAPSCLLAAGDQPQQNDGAADALGKKLIGTWKLEEAKTPGTPSGVGARLKFFTGTHWSIVQPDPATGVIVFQHGGRYELDGSLLKTTRDFAGESTKEMIGTSGKFAIQIDGDTLKQTDVDGLYNETWRRVK